MSAEISRPLTAASFNEYLAEHKLMGARCLQCGALYLPPRALCPACFSAGLAWEELPGAGSLAAFTSIYIAPTFMEAQGYGRKNPYLTGIVELAEGVKISARLVGLDPAHPESVQIGQPLQVTFLDQGETTQLAFEPAG